MEMNGNFGQVSISIVIKNIFLITSNQNHIYPSNVSLPQNIGHFKERRNSKES